MKVQFSLSQWPTWKLFGDQLHVTYLIFVVVGKTRCNLLFHGPKWLSENLISSGFATWKCHAILVVTCYCPWFTQATPGPCGSCRCRPCGGIHSKSSTSNSAEVQVEVHGFLFWRSTTQPTNQPTLSSFWSTGFLDPGNGWSFSQVPSLFDGPLRLQLQRLQRLPQLLRRRYRHAPSTWDASLRRRAASGEGLE